MLQQIHHVAIIVSNYQKSRAFYVDKLGFPVLRENYRPDRKDWRLELQAGDAELEIFGVENPPTRVTNPEACGLRHLAFRTENIEQTVNWLHSLEIETEPIRLDPITDKRFTFFRDPDGLPLELHE